MTFPSVRSIARGNNTSDITSRSVGLPSSVNAGDKLIALFVNDGAATVTWDNTTVGNWGAPLFTVIDTNSAVRLSIFTKTADGTEGGRALVIGTSAPERSAWEIYALSDASEIEFAVDTAQGVVNSPNPPSLTPTGGATDRLWLAVFANDKGQYTSGPFGVPSAAGPNSSPAGYTSIYDQSFDSGGGGTGLGSGYKTSSAASEDPGAWNLKVSQWVIAATIAVRSGQTIAAPFFENASTFYAAVIRNGIFAPFIDSGAQFFSAVIVGDQIIEAPFAASGAQFFDATIVTAEIGVPFIPSAEQFFGAAIEIGPAVVVAPFIASGAHFFKGLVIGGDRTTPTFSSVSAGPFPGAVGDIALYDGSSQGAAFSLRWQTRGPIGFSDFTAFVAGEYEFDEAVIWLRLSAPEVAQVFAITRAKLSIDVPDVIDRGEVEIPAGGAWVTFSRTFYQPPEVVAQVIRAADVDTVPRATVRDDIDATRFFVTLHLGDDVTNSVAGRIKYIATGY